MAEKLLPCPFCNSTNIDQEGWKSSDGTSGPACDDCCGSANSIVEWNTRPREGSPPPAVEGGWREKPTNANNMIGTRWRHKKRGSEYVVVDGMAEVQVSEGRELTDYECVVVYKGTDGRHWVRPRAEFFDGRFEPLPTPPAGEKP